MRLAANQVAYLALHAVVFLTGIVLIQLGNPVLIAVGAALVAAGVVGWVIFGYVLLTDRTLSRLALIERFGFVTGFEARAARIRGEYDSRLQKAHEHIDILGFGLRALREDYSPAAFQAWRSRAHVRILLLDPSFPSNKQSLAAQRDVEEQNPKGTIGADSRDFVSSAKALLTQPGPYPFEVRLYRCIPSVNIFRVDSELFWGPYLIKQQSRNTPTFLVRQGGILFDLLVRHFDAIWTSNELSRPVPQEWLNG